MPFPQQTPKAFNRQNIEALRTGQIGCYGLYRDKTWIYIGRGDIRQRLLDHLNGDNSCINTHHPSHWVDVVSNEDEKLEKQLILEYGPVCNKQAG